MAIKKNGEAAFLDAGKGAFFCFNLLDIAELEEKYGVGEYLQTIDANLQQGSGTTAWDCIRIGLKHKVEGKRVPLGLEADDINFAIVKAHPKIMDALCLAVSDMTYQEMLEEIAKREDELKALLDEIPDNPDESTNPLTDSMESSDTKPSDTGQD